MSKTRLNQAIDGGLISLPQTGPIAVLRPRPEHDLSALPKDRVHIIQGNFTSYHSFSARGFDCRLTLSGAYGAALIFLPRSRGEARSLIAGALAATGGGPVLVDGQKTDGVNSILKECRARGAQISGILAKSHGRIFVVTGGDFAEFADPAPLHPEPGFISRAGVFSADRVDRGSAALVAALPDNLAGKVADLGAGWGYLAHHILRRTTVSECHLIEVEHDALDCARTNINDPRARFHWADAIDFTTETSFDQVITNPPFHTGRDADIELGRGFIATAARLLTRRGALWLVANRHLPYEKTLSAAFGEVAEVAGDGAFKILRATGARRQAR
ncbi:MAG: class I SAM-dependent methyltransferase [Paracoccaceae bacterium]